MMTTPNFENKEFVSPDVVGSLKRKASEGSGQVARRLKGRRSRGERLHGRQSNRNNWERRICLHEMCISYQQDHRT